MQCKCGEKNRVLETRTRPEGIRRTRVCDNCGHKTYTIEIEITNKFWTLEAELYILVQQVIVAKDLEKLKEITKLNFPNAV